MSRAITVVVLGVFLSLTVTACAGKQWWMVDSRSSETDLPTVGKIFMKLPIGWDFKKFNDHVTRIVRHNATIDLQFFPADKVSPEDAVNGMRLIVGLGRMETVTNGVGFEMPYSLRYSLPTETKTKGAIYCGFLPDYDNVIVLVHGEWFSDEDAARYPEFEAVAMSVGNRVTDSSILDAQLRRYPFPPTSPRLRRLR